MKSVSSLRCTSAMAQHMHLHLLLHCLRSMLLVRAPPVIEGALHLETASPHVQPWQRCSAAYAAPTAGRWAHVAGAA